MNTGILYICTGKYSIFWDEFYKSCETHFLPNCKKKYFVFSDTLNKAQYPDNVELIYQEKLGWPYDTLKRFDLFLSIKNELSALDYLFFMNANLVVQRDIDDAILFVDNKPADLIVTHHPFFHWVEHSKHFPYERRKRSTACMGKNEGNMYAFGALNGGTSESYLEMAATLSANIQKDLDNNIIALWHDESQLNKYIWMTNKTVRRLDHNYAFPERHDLPLKDEIYITVLDKAKFGGHDFLREQENSIPVTPAAGMSLVERIKNKLF